MQQKMASVLPATGTTALAEPHRAVKRPRAPRKSVTESMDSAAEQLWSAKTRDFLEFDSIAPTNGLPLGGVGVAAGSKGDAAFYSYLKQPAVIARLQAEGFERASWGAPHHSAPPGLTTVGAKIGSTCVPLARWPPLLLHDDIFICSRVRFCWRIASAMALNCICFAVARWN